MDISVIIPSYKPQEYIWECLDSLYNQTFAKENFEVILVLNGCKDPYYSEIKDWIDKHPGMNVNFIQTDTPGVSNARNIGIEASQGEYITFIDDDDYVSDVYLQELAEKARPNTISLCNTQAFSESEEVKQEFWVEGVFEKLNSNGKVYFTKARKYFGGPVYKLIHHSVIGDRRFYTSLKRGEDSVFMFLISDKFKYVDFTSAKAIYYRRYRYGQATSQTSILSRVPNSVLLIYYYCNIYIKNIGKYNLYFFVTRILGAIRTIIKA